MLLLRENGIKGKSIKIFYINLMKSELGKGLIFLFTHMLVCLQYLVKNNHVIISVICDVTPKL